MRVFHHSVHDVPVEKFDAFLADIQAVCERHGMSIGHEDTGGGFRVGTADEYDAEWFAAASPSDELAKHLGVSVTYPFTQPKA